MKKQYSLSIEQPCSEKWENFKPTATGGFCSSCQKNVVDFTKMTDKEIIDFLGQSSGNTCGRFRNDQLNHIYIPTSGAKTSRTRQILKTGVAGLSMLLFAQMGLAQNLARSPKTEVVSIEQNPKQNQVENPEKKTVAGTVFDEYGEPLPGVNIILKGTSQGTVTGLDGKFEFSGEFTPGDILAFYYIGYETKEFKIGKDDFSKVTLIEMEMKMDTCVMLGEVSVSEIYQSKSSGIGALWSKIKGLF